MPGSLYQVVGWDDHFENNKSRERDQCGFVCVPNKQSGLGFSRLLALKDGATIYGVWCLLLGALSRQRKPRQGWLTEDGHQTGTPWTAGDLGLIFRRPEAEIARALEVLTSPQIGWIIKSEVVESELSGTNEPIGSLVVPALCPSDALERKKEVEEKRKKARADSALEVEDYCQSLGLPRSDGTFMWENWNSKDWMSGTNKIKDWKATIRTWNAGKWLPSQKQNGKQIPVEPPRKIFDGDFHD